MVGYVRDMTKVRTALTAVVILALGITTGAIASAGATAKPTAPSPSLTQLAKEVTTLRKQVTSLQRSVNNQANTNSSTAASLAALGNSESADAQGIKNQAAGASAGGATELKFSSFADCLAFQTASVPVSTPAYEIAGGINTCATQAK